jgi:hypothetical protein
MPKLNRDLIREWLEEHNWSVQRLTEECNAISEDTFTEGTLRNAVNGIDPMRPGRIRIISKVTRRYSDGLSYEQLISDPGPLIDVAARLGHWVAVESAHQTPEQQAAALEQLAHEFETSPHEHYKGWREDLAYMCRRMASKRLGLPIADYLNQHKRP